jgi:hypothetical protein
LQNQSYQAVHLNLREELPGMKKTTKADPNRQICWLQD